MNSNIEVFYFGREGHSLLGTFHPSSPGVARDVAVVLCPPWGDEYYRSHRAYRHLAARLAEAGCPTLRFDLFGCGDSEGDEESARLSHWLGDVSTAVEAVRSKSGLVDVCLVGFRLGASLATLAAAEIDEICALVLWDPVIRGRDFVDELEVAHRDLLDGFPVALTRSSRYEHVVELSGFAVSPALLDDLGGFDLEAVDLGDAGSGRHPSTATEILLIDTTGETGEVSLLSLEGLGAHTTRLSLGVSETWIRRVDLALVPHEVLDGVVSWLTELYP
jgi:pimeloyl-ACP methyl ester carboxylesterase